MSKHIDGLTGQEFSTEEEYLAHVSPVTGYKPTDLEHHGVQGLRIAKKALERTGSLKKENEDELDVKIEKVREDKVDEKVRGAKKGNRKLVKG